MIRSLEEAARTTGLPERIVTDNGPEFRSRAMPRWAQDRGIEYHFIDPSKPTQAAFIVSFNARLRDECLNEHVFSSVQEAQDVREQWRQHSNQERPHTRSEIKHPMNSPTAHFMSGRTLGQIICMQACEPRKGHIARELVRLEILKRLAQGLKVPRSVVKEQCIVGTLTWL